jgi:hypothetical protein
MPNIELATIEGGNYVGFATTAYANIAAAYRNGTPILAECLAFHMRSVLQRDGLCDHSRALVMQNGQAAFDKLELEIVEIIGLV